MMKKLFSFSLGLLLISSVHATVYFTDHFDYSTGNLGTVGSAAGWNNSNSGVTVTTGSLDGTGLGLEASSGNKVTTTTASSSGTYNQFSSGIPTGVVYFSSLLRVNSTAGLSSGGQVITGLIRAGSQSSYYIDIVLKLNGSNVEVGLAKYRQVTNWYGAPLSVGNTCLIVGKYEFVSGSNNDRVSLWVNPAALGGSEPGADVSFTNGGDGNTSTGIGRYFIYGGAAVDVDEVRIGSTWAEATTFGRSVAASHADALYHQYTDDRCGTGAAGHQRASQWTIRGAGHDQCGAAAGPVARDRNQPLRRGRQF